MGSGLTVLGCFSVFPEAKGALLGGPWGHEATSGD